MLKKQLSILLLTYFGVVAVSHADITCVASFTNLKNHNTWQETMLKTSDIGNTATYEADDRRGVNYSASVNKQPIVTKGNVFDIILTIGFPDFSTDSISNTTEFHSTEDAPFMLYMQKHLKQYKIDCNKPQ